MHICKNNKNKKYTGKENTPLGRGFHASGYKEGKRMKGNDGNFYKVKGNRWQLVISKSQHSKQKGKKNKRSARGFGGDFIGASAGLQDAIRDQAEAEAVEAAAEAEAAASEAKAAAAEGKVAAAEAAEAKAEAAEAKAKAASEVAKTKKAIDAEYAAIEAADNARAHAIAAVSKAAAIVSIRERKLAGKDPCDYLKNEMASSGVVNEDLLDDMTDLINEKDLECDPEIKKELIIRLSSIYSNKEAAEVAIDKLLK